MKRIDTRRITMGPAETRALAQEMAKTLERGTVLAFHGELGAGKTCFIQGLAAGLGVTQAVSSPTFTLINEYKGEVPLYHIDLYRIHGEQEALAMGLDEYLYGDGITAIEWAERVGELLPEDTVHVRMELGTHRDERMISFVQERTREEGCP